jgi:hypothetical protein
MDLEFSQSENMVWSKSYNTQYRLTSKIQKYYKYLMKNI